MSLDNARHALRGLRRDVKELENGDFSVEVRGVNHVLKKDELEFYSSTKGNFIRSSETQLFFHGMYEHVVQFEGAGPRRYARRDENLSLESPDGKIRIEIGKLSSNFCLSLTDVDNLSKELRRHTLPVVMGRQDQDRTLGDLFRLYSIKVKTQEETSLGKSVFRLHELAEAAIFHFAYGQGTSISFTKSWERTYYWLGRKESESVQFPLRTYNQELISYYNLALASDSLVLGYLALYKILEYFYTSVSENAIHKKVKEHLVAPDFSHTKPKKLRELIKSIRQFESKLDELSCLKLVLLEYFDKSDLRRWVEEYEKQGEEYFTKDASVFGRSDRIDLSDGSVIPNMASRIYYIRNALVHNKEGEIARFIPYTGQEEVLQKEVMLLLYIAEQLIIKTGKDLSL